MLLPRGTHLKTFKKEFGRNLMTDVMKLIPRKFTGYVRVFGFGGKGFDDIQILFEVSHPIAVSRYLRRKELKGDEALESIKKERTYKEYEVSIYLFTERELEIAKELSGDYLIEWKERDVGESKFPITKKQLMKIIDKIRRI